MISFTKFYNKNKRKQIQQIVIEINRMSSDINTGLIGFLQKKSLFSSATPTKSINKNQLKSTIDIYSDNKINDMKLQESNFNDNYEQKIEKINPVSLNLSSNNRFGKTSNKKINSDASKLTFNNNNNLNNPQNSYFKSNNKSHQNLINKVVKQVTNFQSARVESLNCLEELSIKIHSEISRINYKIQVFHDNIYKVLNTEFKNMKEKVNKMVEQMFEQSEKIIREYITEQESLLAKELVSTKKILQKQYIKVENMKHQINGQAWRKAVGELLSTQLEQKVQAILKESKHIQIGNWSKSNFFDDKIIHFQRSLKSMVQLTKEKDKKQF